MVLSFDQLRALAASVGFPDPALMAAIALAESGGNTNAVNDTRGLTDDQIRAKFGLPAGTQVSQEWSIGLWQINALSGDVDPSRLVDPTYNAQMAYARSAGGTNLNPWWLTVSRGAYKRYLPPAPAPSPFPGVTPPAPQPPGSGIFAAAAAATAMAISAALVASVGRARRREPEYEPEPEPEVP